MVVLFLVMDGVMKLFTPAPVTEAMNKLGYNPAISVALGIILLICTMLYAIKSTSILGAILLTGYLGGAVASHVRIDQGLFSEVFPVLFGVFAWGGLYLRDSRLRQLIPVRN